MKEYFVAYSYQGRQYTIEFAVPGGASFSLVMWNAIATQRGYYKDKSVFVPPEQAKDSVTIQTIVQI